MPIVRHSKPNAHDVCKGATTLLPAEVQPPLPPAWRRWSELRSVARALASDVHDGGAPALAALNALELAASNAVDNAEGARAARAAIVSARCELLARTGTEAAAWADDAATAVELDGESAVAWLTLARARCGQKRFAPMQSPCSLE